MRRDVERVIIDAAHECGLAVEFPAQNGHKHPHARLSRNGAVRKVYFSSTPRTENTDRIAQEIRRIARAMP